MSSQTESQAENIQTILTGLSLLGVIIAIAALGIERVRRIRENDRGYQVTKPAFVGCFATKRVNAFKTLLGYEAAPLILPTIRGIIETADQNYWTSTTLDHLNSIEPDLTWLPLCEAIFDELRHHKEDLPERWIKETVVSTVFNRLESKAREDEKKYLSKLPQRRRDLVEKGYLKSGIRRLPETKDSPTHESDDSKDEIKGLARLKPAWMLGKIPYIPVPREELAALALMMGMPVAQDNAGFYSGIGAYGLSMDIAHTEATWKLSLVKGSRIPRHAPSMGSGYTSLMAKHLACGSIPFGQGNDWVRSVYVTPNVLDAIKKGICITDSRAYGGPSLEFLRRLPGDKPIDAYYARATKERGTDPGSILNAMGEEVGRWSRLIAGIAFGGLVPQADSNVIEAVKFTVAGKKLDDCVQYLELLVDELHKAVDNQNAKLRIFGDRVAERTAAKGHMYVNHIFPSTDKNPRDAASIFARYMNLLEHSQPSDSLFEHTVALLERVHKEAVKVEIDRGTPLEFQKRNLVDEDLGKTLQVITADLEMQNSKTSTTNVTLALDQAASIVRCILAAWAYTVPPISVLEHLPATPSTAAVQSTSTRVTFSMDALPSVVALG
ncbi:hypothetical protein QBC35DRAFT_523025 [Podospora australis]|uniref:Uncharacterized protein n=1 Tax=Podospora australis TaxID=1536484 RepID=A0AAN7AIW2_9PEZI|nr:hypothetical protein QBC35DRAFT_523025 [Podospora australis]